ncbi:TetR/AcrR family transcriptional regulator [Ruegeria sp. 2205SS24-7]|uniref:TetR/AcrR family transcriptional regulator n=1 Tax=Ruegeria discodermiae TaxID=3064389 RepID=UPI002741DE71|nr:TetR/AcrR family transcriptional regulator [Ruegeria sp. 2205SS24-7]MDP5217769.1 TetR/AcrR family transcriptional regulator [Ruegeria sp. 2205SS24-7]
MSAKTEARKAALRDKLVAAAERRIAKDGASSLRARDLAQDAGCALGAIYNAFDDLNAIVMAVNGRTFSKLGQAVADSFDGSEEPVQRLIKMSHAYLNFASEHANLWRALFDLEMTADGPVPVWYLEALRGLFAHITEPLSEIFPELSKDDLQLMTRALFSSVHGIVLLGLENRISGVPADQIERMIALVLLKVGNK